MARLEDSAQDFGDFWIRADSFDDGFDGDERRINLLARGHGAIGFRGVSRVE
jgi:hypothetical protein